MTIVKAISWDDYVDDCPEDVENIIDELNWSEFEKVRKGLDRQFDRAIITDDLDDFITENKDLIALWCGFDNWEELENQHAEDDKLY